MRSSKPHTHGLYSRARAKGEIEVATQLGEEILGDAPRTTEIISTAAELARSVLLLQSIRFERRRLLSTPPVKNNFDVVVDILGSLEALCTVPELDEATDIDDINKYLLKSAGNSTLSAKDRKLQKKLQRIPKILENHSDARRVIDLFVERRAEISRLDEYERKALSRRNKLVNRLDYLVIEARRKQTSSSGVSSRRQHSNNAI